MTLTKEEIQLIKRYRKSRATMLQFVVKDYFNGVTEADVLKTVGSNLVKGKKKITVGEVEMYNAGANEILKNIVWEEMYNSCRHEANKRMFETGQTVEDLQFGRALLYCIEMIRLKLEHLSKLK